ncbi:MAG: prepilin-type N-terminal cleavage/methylation domain-containing protein, partial [Chitinivibrionales bacterium]|nr:prepilin-type N-terminal cleavage/methylation domain-containing protein [Chitinivibrionales bacterium]
MEIYVKKHNNGVTLIELAVTIAVAAIVAGVVAKLYYNFSKQNQHQRSLAELRSNMTRVSELIERDIRMTGYGISGNGIEELTLNEGNDEILLVFDNGDGTTSLAEGPSSGASCINVAGPALIRSGHWLALIGEDTLFREVGDISGFSQENCNIPLTEPLPTPSGLEAGDGVTVLAGVEYYIADDNDGGTSFVRKKNGKEMRIPYISKLEIIPRDGSGNDLSSEFENTRSVS